MNNKKLTLALVFLMAFITGCITVTTCEEAGHRFVGESCSRCGQLVPWMAGK